MSTSPRRPTARRWWICSYCGRRSEVDDWGEIPRGWAKTAVGVICRGCRWQGKERQGNAATPGVDRTPCVICGKMFKPSRSWQQTCSRSCRRRQVSAQGQQTKAMKHNMIWVEMEDGLWRSGDWAIKRRMGRFYLSRDGVELRGYSSQQSARGSAARQAAKEAETDAKTD